MGYFKDKNNLILFEVSETTNNKRYKLVKYNKDNNTEEFIASFNEKNKVFSIMKIELNGLPNVNKHYIVTEFNDYTRYKNGIYEFRLYDTKKTIKGEIL